MPSARVACMYMLCYPPSRIDDGLRLKKGWHDGPTAWALRQYGEIAGPSPHVARRDCRGGRVCCGAEPADLRRGLFPRGSAPDCGHGVAQRAPGPLRRWGPRGGIDNLTA